MDTIKSAFLNIEDQLGRAGIENTRGEARMLICHVMGIQTQIVIGYPERELSVQEREELAGLLERRVKREPLSQILGEREFWSLPFKVTKDTLSPRPDSETLIEAVLRQFPDPEAPLKVLDLGVGTGCLLLATLSEYEAAQGLGVDASPAALAVAQENAQHLGLSQRCAFQEGDWGKGLTQTFDLVLSNPPYIALHEKDDLEPEVRDFEPGSALFAGQDGLDDYRVLAQQIPSLLKDKNARAIIELGAGQAPSVSALMEDRGLHVIEQPKDLGGHIRCLVLGKKT